MSDIRGTVPLGVYEAAVSELNRMRSAAADSLDDAWAEAEAACAELTDRGSQPNVPCWPKLQGPWPGGPVLYPQTYQANVNNVDGGRRVDERIGLGPTPVAALRALTAELRAHASQSMSTAAARCAPPER